MTINLRKITQGERGTLTFTWEFPENITSPASISGAVITATMTDEDGLTTDVSGALTGTAATTCTWALSAGDSGTAGTFTVLFAAIVTGVTTYTLEATLEVIANPAVTGTQNDPLVSISAADAAWVTLAATAVPDGADVVDVNDLGTAAAADVGDFDAAGAAAAAQAAAIAASVSKAGDTMAGLMQFSGTNHAGIKLNALTAAQRDALAAAAGMVIFNSDAGEPCYHDGIVWRQFSDNALALPLELDFTEMSDGALPTIFTAPTFTISSGKATNNPVLGSELLTNPGLEGTYTSGLSPNLTKTGSPTVSEATGANAHGGTSAQQFTGAAFNDRLNWPTFAGVAGAWYKFSLWAKRTAGTAANTNMIAEATGNIPSSGGSQRIFGVSWQQEAASFITTGTANIYIFPAREATGGGSYDTVIVDDGSVKRITYADLFALFDSGDRTAITKAQPSPLVDGTLSAVVAWAGGASSPDTYVMAYWRYRSQKDRISFGMIKCVSGTYTSLIAEQSAVTVTDAWLEIRPVSSTQVALYYNNVQIGTTQTVNDCPGSYAGFLVSGGNNIKRFFVVAP